MKISFVQKAGFLLCLFFVSRSPWKAQADGGQIPLDQGHFSQPRFHSSVSLRQGYDDNVNTTNTGQTKSPFTDLEANAFADLGSDRTALTIGVTAGVTYYEASVPTNQYQYLGSLNLSLSHKVNERFTLSLSSFSTYQVEPDFTLQVAQNRVNGQYFYTGDTLSATYQWTRRFSTVTSYQFVGIFYQDATQKVLNDYFTQTFSNQFRYQVHPTSTLVAEYRLGLTNYLYGTDRDTLTHFLLAGFDHSFSPKFNVSLRAGGQLQNQQSGPTNTSPYGELDLNYSYRRNSSISFNMNYGFQYSDLTFAQTNRELRVGFTINHAFTPKLSAYVAFFYEHDDYSNGSGGAVSTTDDTFNISTGVRLTINARWSLQAGYTRTELLSDQSFQNYNRDVVTLGATYSF